MKLPPITMYSFITDVIKLVDKALLPFVKHGFTQLVANQSKTIALIMTFYVIWYGYRALQHTSSLSFSEITRHFITLLVVYGLIMHWDLFELFFYNTFTNEPIEIIKSLLQVIDHNLKEGSVLEELNNIFNTGMQTAYKMYLIFSAHMLTDWVYLLFGFLIMIMTAAMCLYALSLWIYAKMALAIILVLAPLFLLCLLWPSTKSFFERWIQALANYALIPIILCSVIVLMMSLFNTTLPNVSRFLHTGEGCVSDILPFLSVCFIGILLLRQVLSISAVLSAGMALESMPYHPVQARFKTGVIRFLTKLLISGTKKPR